MDVSFQSAALKGRLPVLQEAVARVQALPEGRDMIRHMRDGGYNLHLAPMGGMSSRG